MLNLDGSYKQENYESYGHELVEFSRRSFELSRSTEPADRELMERHVRTLYKWLDKREPSMVWCDSPLQIFALPYIIDCYAKSGDVSWEQVWMQAEERYFSRLPDSVLYNLDLDRIKDRISTLCLDRRCGYRLQDAIDVNRVLELRLRQLVSMKYAFESEHGLFLPVNYRKHDPSLWRLDDRIQRNNYDDFNWCLFRDFNTPILIQHSLDRVATSSETPMRYRGEKALRFLLDDVDAELDANWQGSSGQILGCGLDAKEWSAFFPDYAAYSYKAGFGQQMGRYWCYVFRNWNDDEKPLVMPTILWAELLMQLRYIVCYEHTVFLSERPVVWSFDPTDRLHCESGPAIKFKDGYSQYFWRGLNVDAWVIEDEPTLENIEKAWNIEVRRVLIERCGLQKYLFDSGAKVIHKDEWGTLYRKEMERDEPILMLHVVNKTAEPDGSFKDYFLRVPPTMQTAHEAVAWTFDLDAQSYHPRQET